MARLDKPLTLNSLMSDGGFEFALRSEDLIDTEEETNIETTYPLEQLECFSSAYRDEPYEDENENDNDQNVDADKNKNVEDFEIYRRRMKNVRDDGKLMKLIEKPGVGDLIPDDGTDNWVVYLHYAGYADHAEYTFDASHLRQKKPVRYRLDELFYGFHLAVRTMRKGEKSKFLIHPDLMYGSMGVGPRFPGDQTLSFDIELFDFVQNEELDDMDDTKTKLPESFRDVIEITREYRERGNKRKTLGKKDLNGAMSQYRKGICFLEQAHASNEEEATEKRLELVKLYTNLALCHLSKQDYRRVCKTYDNAVERCQAVASNHVKLNYLSAKALRLLGDFREAQVRIHRANKLKPGDPDILNELNELEEAIKKYKTEQSKSARRMFGFKSETPDSNKKKENIDELLNEVDEEFRNMFDEVLTEFIDNDEQEFHQLPVCSLAERTYCERICRHRNKNIRVREVGPVGEKRLLLTKFPMST